MLFYNHHCLNPCFSGTYSRRYSVYITRRILCVLILVLVEHTLGASLEDLDGKIITRLNPCFSGTYSRSMFNHANNYYDFQS